MLGSPLYIPRFISGADYTMLGRLSAGEVLVVTAVMGSRWKNTLHGCQWQVLCFG
jgi:hypothetical protein